MNNLSRLGSICAKFSRKLYYRNYGTATTDPVTGMMSLPTEPVNQGFFYGLFLPGASSFVQLAIEGSTVSGEAKIYSKRDLEIEPSIHYSIISVKNESLDEYRVMQKTYWELGAYFVYRIQKLKAGLHTN